MKAPLDHIPSGLLTLDDYEQLAQSFIDEPTYTYISSGAGQEATLIRNRSAFGNISILPRVLQDVTSGNLSTDLSTMRLSSPLMLAPVAHHGLVHDQGELAMAQAAEAMNIPMVVSTLSSKTLEEISQQTTANLWFQLYIQPNELATQDLIKRAEAAGYQALVITVDAPLSGLRYKTQRSGFKWPESVQSANLQAYAAQEPLPLYKGQSAIFQGIMRDAPTWESVEAIIQSTTLPVWIKGVTHPLDVAKAKSIGVSGVIISNHGGRVLDDMPSSLSRLPIIRSEVGAHYPLILDGGIRSGADLFKARALGADAMMIGRPQLYALAIAGALGVAHMIQTLQQELEITMALAGCPTISSITSASIHCRGELC